jgi:hypothetical protein
VFDPVLTALRLSLVHLKRLNLRRIISIIRIACTAIIGLLEKWLGC